MIRLKNAERRETFVVSMRVKVELAEWITRCAGFRRRSTAAIILLETLQQTMPQPQLEAIVRQIRHGQRAPRALAEPPEPEPDAP